MQAKIVAGIRKESNVYILTNAAGELSAWVKPIAEELERSWPEARVVVVLTPSQYLTGQEEEYTKALPGVDQVIPVKDFRKLLFMGTSYLKEGSNLKGCILSLGGDLIYPVLLKARLGYPAFAYIEKRKQWVNQFVEFFTRDTVGDLMVDSLAGIKPPTAKALTAPDFRIALLPGSRSFQLKYMIPFYTRVAEQLQYKYPNLQFVWKISPFSSKDFQRFNKSAFPVSNSLEGFDLAITIPGTNTAHLSIMGIPILCVMPLNWPQVVPLEGIWEYLGRLPLLGSIIKELVIRIAIKSMRYLALPNIIAKQMVVPEVWGRVTEQEVALAAEKLLLDMNGREAMGKQIRAIMGPGGAAKKIVSEIKETVLSR
ncbi:MAG: hypothetical protein WC838_06625 [Candidatus Margulisiibacteriota bacterium]|jgi:lipid-A-disaccharide synthase